MTNQTTEPTASTPETTPAPPAEFSLAWYDALIQQKQAQAQEMYAQYNQALGVLETLVGMRELAAAKETDNGSTQQ